MTETLEHGYSSASTQRELSNEYKHDIVSMASKIIASLHFGRKEAPALEGLRMGFLRIYHETRKTLVHFSRLEKAVVISYSSWIWR